MKLFVCMAVMASLLGGCKGSEKAQNFDCRFTILQEASAEELAVAVETREDDIAAVEEVQTKDGETTFVIELCTDDDEANSSVNREETRSTSTSTVEDSRNVGAI